MSLPTLVLIVLVILLHLYFLVLEMFLWDKPLGLKTFGLDPTQAAATKVLAMNQGLYNGFLAAGLGWGLWLGDNGQAVSLFFLGCVVLAGIFGGLTVKPKVFLVQALPALAAIASLLLPA